MLDLTKYKSCKGAATALAGWLNEQGWRAVAISPKESVKRVAEGANGWHVLCEECPYEGLIALSLGGSVYAGAYGYYDDNGNYKKPEVKMTNSDHWIAEPYYSWALGFYPDV